MRVLIKNGRVFGANARGGRVLDVLISGARIKEIGPNIKEPGARVIDARGMLVVPGLVDAHVHFREPGFERKEDIRSGSRAAAAGGFTTVIAEPNTNPPIDTPSRLTKVLKIARKKSIVNFFSKAALSRGIRGERLTDISSLKKAGACALSDDGNPVPGKRLARNGLIQGKRHRLVVSPHCEESDFYRARVKGKISCRSKNSGMPYARGGVPYTSEAGFIARDILLAKETGARLHISHVSLAESVRLIAEARDDGVKVTAEAAPHHFLLTEKMAGKIGTNAKVNPPLRSEEDVKAIKQGLANGTIDIIASDHAPHTPEEKERPWNDAPFGLIGLETTLGLVLTHLVKPGVLSMEQAIDKMSFRPAEIFGLSESGIGHLVPGKRADMVIIDPKEIWRVDVNRFYSKGRNCPFNGWDLCGRAKATIVGGRVVMIGGKLQGLA